MLLATYYAQNYAGIIGWSLYLTIADSQFDNFALGMSSGGTCIEKSIAINLLVFVILDQFTLKLPQVRYTYACIAKLGHYLMIFCFSSENSKFEVRAGGSLPLSIIVKIICKMCKNLNQYKILVYCDPPPM